MPRFILRASFSYRRRLYQKGLRRILIPFKLLFKAETKSSGGVWRHPADCRLTHWRFFSEAATCTKALDVAFFFFFLGANQLSAISQYQILRECQRGIDYVYSLFAALVQSIEFLYFWLRNVWAAGFLQEQCAIMPTCKRHLCSALMPDNLHWRGAIHLSSRK